MAARRRSEDESTEVGLVADPDAGTEDEVPEGFSVAGDDEDGEDELDEDDELDDDELDEDELDDDAVAEEGLDEDDLADVDAVLSGAAAATTTAPAVEAAPETVVLPSDDDEDEIEAIRGDIEFVCVRCRLVKRTAQLAKGARKKEPFCRSCA